MRQKEFIKENCFLIYDNPKETNRLIKKMICGVRRVFYSMLLKVCCPSDYCEKKYNVSILAIFKNEAQYLREWIEFHRIVGIDHFYLYNNNSEDDYQKVLQPYIDEGLVTLIPWPKNQAQMECYNDGISRFREDSKWIAIIDIDEFIVPNLTDNVYDFLKKYEDKPAVIGYWKFFGTSGKMDRIRTSLVAEEFTVGWRKYVDIGKCFYNTRYDFDGASRKNGNLHHFMWANAKGHNLPPINVFGKICFPNNHPIPRYADAENFPLQINHYFTKSYKEYMEKCSKGDVYYKQNPHDTEYFFIHEMSCQKADYHAYKYLIKLKQVMCDQEKI